MKVKPPRLAESPVAMECKVRQIIPIGTGPIAANLVIGEVLMIHVADAVLDAQGRVDPRKLKTVARLGGDCWCHTSDLFERSGRDVTTSSNLRREVPQHRRRLTIRSPRIWSFVAASSAIASIT